MSIHVALHHKTSYAYSAPVKLGPQIVRLRPAPHCRTPILSYSLRVYPKDHFINWQQDPHGNYLARLVFPEKTRTFTVETDLVADMTVINPFDFFLEESSETYPFEYEPTLKKDLQPFLEKEEGGEPFNTYLRSISGKRQPVNDFLVGINQKLQGDISYLIRMEPGVQSCEQTLTLRSGSCRDSAWLMAQLLRHLGLATRFVSGYLIQLKGDIEALDGASGPEKDFTDLHAWTEVYLPGAGWIGLDPTSGLFAGEGHIPLACTPQPSSAAPITGGVDPCEVEFAHTMSVSRFHEDPRVTKPYSEAQWLEIDRIGRQVEEALTKNDVRLTMGGEPTFVSIDDMEGEQWNTAALGREKRERAGMLFLRLKECWALGGLLHYGQGKWYPGEELPRWALSCYWREDGKPIWKEQNYLADPETASNFVLTDARTFINKLCANLSVEQAYIIPAYEDIGHYIGREQRLPVNVDPLDSKLENKLERERLARLFSKDLGEPVGYLVPLQAEGAPKTISFRSGPWYVRGKHLFLVPGDSYMGLRLPLDSLPWVAAADKTALIYRDPTERKEALQDGYQAVAAKKTGKTAQAEKPATGQSAADLVHTALCVEPRDGHLCVFMPPIETVEAYLALVACIEKTATALDVAIVLEGYTPPLDDRIRVLKITPDPGVIEVNMPPVASWSELVEKTRTLYQEARLSRLGTEKFMLDGRHSGTGGGNHVVLGGTTPQDSPFLRRPDVLASFLRYFQNHPSLTYIFSCLFVGPTSQAPRVDEGRPDNLYELEIALQQVEKTKNILPWLVDRYFRHLLVDLTGNTHRAEFCIDKLYSPDTASGRLGLVELRGFEMPPHAEMSLAQQLLIRALTAFFWERPYTRELIRWGTRLHDDFMLPYFIEKDFREVLGDLNGFGYDLRFDHFAAHTEFRFPAIGRASYQGIELAFRQAIEPWYVLGEEQGGGGTARYVDSSCERLQVEVKGMNDGQYLLTCNGRALPLHATGRPGHYVAAVRYRAWQPSSCLHPTIPVHTPLVFDLIDTWSQHSIGGCTYHVSHPGGRSYETFPVNANEAEARRVARFFKIGHTPGPIEKIPGREENPDFPLTLDLRRA